MKIAIKGHPTRGKEVIQILESLGGVNSCSLKGNTTTSHYYINYDSNNKISCLNFKYVNEHCKTYTLEEFEKEFPFKIGDEVMFPVKIGWASGKITGLTYVEDQLKYEVNNRIAGYRYIEPHKLNLYPMKEERNIKLTLDKAKEWYKKGGELKEIALQAFTEKELNTLPRSWEEFCEDYSRIGYCISSNGKLLSCMVVEGNLSPNICPSRKSAEAHLAMIQLEQLRNCWWNGWVPNWSDRSEKWCIALCGNELSVSITTIIPRFLTFPTEEMAKEFLGYFRDLIEQAGDLI